VVDVVEQVKGGMVFLPCGTRVLHAYISLLIFYLLTTLDLDLDLDLAFIWAILGEFWNLRLMISLSSFTGNGPTAKGEYDLGYPYLDDIWAFDWILLFTLLISLLFDDTILEIEEDCARGASGSFLLGVGWIGQ
jgi:hypothetical protein